MSQKNINLTEAEWSVMECLWEKSPLTGRQVTECMEQKIGWKRKFIGECYDKEASAFQRGD